MPAKNRRESERSALFRVFGDENRLRIVEILLAGPQNVSALVERVGMEQSLISHHLAALRKGGIVKSFREGREIFYELLPALRVRGAPRQIELGCCRIMLNSADLG